ncbi:MAG: 50S ribosomal protein L21 [Verrucomicrobia bacterium]|nr:50S ribosomal protein L21 [Verrucomicrobiota bacterium]
MAYAILKTGGKQYKVAAGDEINVDLLDAKEGDKVKFGEVLMTVDGSNVRHGKPFIDGFAIEGEVVKQFKDDKVLAFKYRRRKGYHRSVGFRRRLTKVKIAAF